ncbi:kinase-like domain-containing protein [Phakopsora pachyrhizi]|uniref:Kinase-like domain-containing protein n=1 Tax=Phakopsora pachyrhizi TaxID=170000 RepID=A0AAV0AQR7_PHAPC|nr:kinase-like domain-containing protein [Phakopsora pachyrhizi]CAH7671569.1 kinase-like domain-containing protein [Phakopsora pachyrhizi]
MSTSLTSSACSNTTTTTRPASPQDQKLSTSPPPLPPPATELLTLSPHLRPSVKDDPVQPVRFHSGRPALNFGTLTFSHQPLSRSSSLRSNLSNYNSVSSSPPLSDSSSSSTLSSTKIQRESINQIPPLSFSLSSSQPPTSSLLKANPLVTNTPQSSRNDIFSVSLLPLPSPTPSSLSSAHPPHSASSAISKYSPTPNYRLGEGIHGTVYLAAIRQQSCPSSGWKLCAAKVSQDFEPTIHEALVFERLQRGESQSNHHSNVLKFYGVKNLSKSQKIQQVLPSPPQQNFFSSKLDPTPAKGLALLLDYCPLGDLFCFVRNSINQWQDSEPEARASLIRLDRRLWIKWANELIDGLDWCHKCDVLVGDLKPHNILLTNQLKIQLSDFDRSIIVPNGPEDQMLLIDPQGTGTSAYSAPELVQPPPSPFFFPADIFALGVTLYFILTGREPYQSVKSPVERMLLISRGSFWEHESHHRWSSEQSHLSQRLTPRLDSSAIGRLRLLGHPPGQSETQLDFANRKIGITNLASDKVEIDRSQFKSYSDGSPALKFLMSTEKVDESIIKLIGLMCSPSAEDRPSISYLKSKLKSLLE